MNEVYNYCYVRFKSSKHNAKLKIYVFRVNQMSQSFLHWSVLLRNITRNWYLLNRYDSRIFIITSSLFSPDQVLRQQPNHVFFWKKFLWCKKMKPDFFILMTTLGEHWNKMMFFKSIITNNIYIITIFPWHYLKARWLVSDIS